MVTPSFTVQCTANDCIAHTVYELRFTKPEGLTFLPGQFMMFDVPSITDDTDIQPRAYSIASHPSEEDLLFVIRLKPGGRASDWVEKKLKPGMQVQMKGPMGLFKLHADSQKDILFISTGAGIAPFRPMAMQALELLPDRKVDLIHAVSLHEDLFWQEDMFNLAEKHASFQVHHSLSRPNDDWSGLRGRVQEIIPQVVPDIANRRVYVCGNPDMTMEVKKLCLNEWGVPKEEFHMEGYV